MKVSLILMIEVSKYGESKCLKIDYWLWRFGPFGGLQRPFKKLEAVFLNTFNHGVWGNTRCVITNVERLYKKNWKFGPFGGRQRPFQKIRGHFRN